jgi:hypothetical protein
LSDFNESLIARHIFELFLIQNFMKIHPVGAELFSANSMTGGQTENTIKLIVAIHNFANAPKKEFCATLTDLPSPIDTGRN